jgi:hypothetical protein
MLEERKNRSTMHHRHHFSPFQCYLDLSVMLLIIECVLDLFLIGTYTERVFLQLKLH